MKLVKRLLAFVMAIAMICAMTVTAMAATSEEYPTTESWGLYYHPSSSREYQTLLLNYSGNGYTVTADEFSGDCTYMETTIKTSTDNGIVFTRAGTQIYRPYSIQRYINIRASLNIGGGNSATSTGTITCR